MGRMVAFSLSFHLIIIMAIVVVSLISNKTTHIFDASYVTLVTVPGEVVSNQPVIRPSVSGNVEREKKTGVERDRSQTSQKEISRKISPADTKQKEGLNDWWKKNKESLTASNDAKAQAKLTVPPPTIPKTQEKPSLHETERPQPQEKSEGLNDWWKKNKESVEEGNKMDQNSEKTSRAEDKVALNNPNPGNVGIKVDNLSLGFPPIYFESIKNKIQRYWFPTSNLMTVVAFNIKPSGEVAGLQVEKGSGDSFFDRSAIRAVMDSTPLPPFPEGFKEKDLRVHFTFIGEAIR